MFAPAKLNLYLHVTGRRVDLYHELDSLAAFASVGDEVRFEPAATFAFTVEGPQARALRGENPESNLAVKAARTLAALTGRALDVKLTLVKNLPVASGIGGGSSDAAATLRALAQHWGLDTDDPHLYQAAAKHGQDVPVCLSPVSNYITPHGTDEAPQLPHTDIVLVNPGKPLPTPEVYRVYRESGAAFSKAMPLAGEPPNATALAAELKQRGNDLYPAALKLMPAIGDVIAALELSGALLARMSGSGATCFGLFEDRGAARKAASDILAAHPDWWVVPSYLPYKTDRRRNF
jgi:4-diphosphocytidyl-2-C-methyl-D-erythritol kinase